MKNHFKNSMLLAVAMLTVISFTFNACKKDPVDPIITSDYSNLTAVSGLVKNKQGNPLQGVTVTASGKSTVTDANGAFLINEVTYNDRAFIVGSKAGYFKGSVGVKPKKGEVTMVELRMIENTPNFSITPTSTQNLDLSNGAGIRINANSVADNSGGIYTGNLNVSIVHLNPSDPDFSTITPGGDLIGTTTSGATRQLLSYGMLMVQMTDDSGNELQLAPGNSSTLTMPVPAEMMGNAPTTIPLWHFNETSGIWEEEGEATLQGDKYVGTVTHFSTWNCDLPTERGTVRGRVVDCNNQPVAGISVKIGQVSAITGSDGFYERFVPSNTNFSVQVNNPALGIVSEIENVSGVTAGQTQTVPSITIDCLSYISGTVSCSSNLPIVGYAAVNFNGNSLSTYFQNDGTFKIAVPNNGQAASLTIVNSLNNFSKTTNVTFPSLPGTTVNVGNTDVCSTSDPTNPSGGNLQQSFTINGDGFNNQNIVINTIFATGFAVYSISDDLTVGIAAGNSASLNISFPGNSTGSFSLPNDDIVFSTSIDNKQYLSTENLQITVTQYGGVGQKIKGTFSGSAKRSVYNEVTQTVDEFEVTITNGNFEIQRNPDQQ
jgi:hypothetical protein